MADIKSQVNKALADGEELLLLADTDIDREGKFGPRWLAVTSERLMTFAGDGAAGKAEYELPLKDLKSVRAVHLVGQLALEAETDSRRVELLRCSNSLSSKFSKIAKSLADARKDAKRPQFDLEDEEKRRCPQCGRLLPEKGSFCPACLKKGQVLMRIWRYLFPHWPSVVAIVLCMTVGTVIGLAPPYLTKVLVDEVLLGKKGAKLLLLLVGSLVGVQLAATVTGIIRGRLSAWLGSRVVHDLRFDVYQAIQGLNLRRYDKMQTGALISRLTRDTSMLNWMFTDAGIYIIPSVLELAGICVMLFVLNWRLALIVLVPTPGVVFLMVWFYRRMHGLYFSLWQRHAKMSALATDSISGIRVVKAFSQEPKEVRRFGDKSVEYYRAAATAEAMWATAFPIISFIISLGTYMVWYFGGRRVMHADGTLTVGGLVAFLGYLAMFYGPLHMLTGFGNHLNQAFTAAQRLFEIMDADQEAYEATDAVPLREPKGAIRFDNVHFGYLKDRPVLKGMDVAVEAGEMIGLVGRSGAGKTTMTNLICRFYDVDEGAIALDGVDLRNLRLRDLRRQIGIVPQEPFLFDGTIAENIAYANPDATMEGVIRAAIAANAHGFIVRLPDGYDTRCGERGARLSGGEKQRIAIARAILHNPTVLILDEATSSVDTQTEALIQAALANLVKGRTTFAIAHRLSTLRNANRLLVIEDGKQAELGTHDELMAKGGSYAKLVEMQSKLSAIKAVDG
jgi:ATP-binding cassette subfamily B protein